MDLAQSLSMSWEDWVQEEEEWERHSSMEGDPKLGSSPLPLEGDSISDVSMVDEGLLQHDSNVIVEEEREEGMETDAPLDSAAPAPLKEKVMSEDLKAGDHEDHCSQTSEESTDQNPPHDSDPDEDELLGHQPTFLFPGDTLMTLLLSSFPQEKMTCEQQVLFVT